MRRDRARRAGVDAACAGAAVIGFGASLGQRRQFQRRRDTAQEEIAPAPRMDQERVLPDPAEARAGRVLALQHGSRIDERAEQLTRILRPQRIAQFVEAALHDLVIVPTTRVARDFAMPLSIAPAIARRILASRPVLVRDHQHRTCPRDRLGGIQPFRNVGGQVRHAPVLARRQPRSQLVRPSRGRDRRYSRVGESA